MLYYCLLIGDLQCPEKCHPNAKCIELVVGGRKCVCNPGFEGDGIDCAGKFSFLYIWIGIYLIGSALASGWSALGLSPGWGHCAVFLDKALNSHRASLHLYITGYRQI